ncbi:MAG: cytochrome C [Desulfuromonadales bacterium]|nr:cytochrome C [Desulfuromonadales bacterium]NIS43760.1 cytochrome C [Desulfuromonadales bacterium]
MQRSVFPLVVLLLLLPVFAAASPKVFPVDEELYPHYPSLLRLEESGVDFTPPETCRGCHPEQYEQWQGSVHALAFQDPVYQGELNKAFQAVGHRVTRQCEGCHTAAGMLGGETQGAGLSGLSDVALSGVSCDICHSVKGTTHWQTPSREPENGSLVLAPGEVGPDGPVRVKRGPFAPSEGCGMGYHECEESPLHLSSDLCAGCHQVYHYEKHFPLEATYLEWKHGPYAQRNIACQDCHMVETETFLRSADAFEKPKRQEYRHYFNGANYLLYFLAKSAAQKAGDEKLAENLDHKYRMAVARLQAAAELELTPVYRDGALNELKVRVKNRRAGHNLPTSLTNVRQMWLEVTMRDGDGELLLTSGILNEKGGLPEQTRLFNSEGMGDNFHFAIDPWEVTSFSRHETIPPRGYKDVYYGVPASDGEEVRVEVRLRYRQADQKVAEKLLAAVPADIDLEKIYGLKDVPALPVVDMVTSSATLPVEE